MLYWTEYKGHIPDIRGIRNLFDNTIYTFDIETSSFLILNNRIIPGCEYLSLTKDEQENCIFISNMYIWQFSINDVVYYGRTWEEFRKFLNMLNYFGCKEKKYCFVHNLRLRVSIFKKLHKV